MICKFYKMAALHLTAVSQHFLLISPPLHYFLSTFPNAAFTYLYQILDMIGHSLEGDNPQQIKTQMGLSGVNVLALSAEGSSGQKARCSKVKSC